MQRTDEQLIADHLGGDESALGELISANLKPVYNFVYRIVRNEKDAEDVAQETFVKVWRNIRKYRTGQSFKAWLFSIARNTAIDLMRKRKNPVFSDFENDEGENALAENLTDPDPLPDELAVKAEDKELLSRLLENLSGVHREILHLYYNEDLTFNEIAQVTGKSINTVKSRHRRALIALKQLLEGSSDPLLNKHVKNEPNQH